MIASFGTTTTYRLLGIFKIVKIIIYIPYHAGCPSPAPKFSGPTVQPGVVSVNWTAAGSSDPLVTGVRYALYSQCGAETTFQLIDDDIQGLSYDITTLPSLTQCVLRVVVYSDHCLLDVDGLLGDTTDKFTTGKHVILCNYYIILTYRQHTYNL